MSPSIESTWRAFDIFMDDTSLGRGSFTHYFSHRMMAGWRRFRDHSQDRTAGQFLMFFFFFLHGMASKLFSGILGDAILTVASQSCFSCFSGYFLFVCLFFVLAPFIIGWDIVRSSILIGPNQWYWIWLYTFHLFNTFVLINSFIIFASK